MQNRYNKLTLILQENPMSDSRSENTIKDIQDRIHAVEDLMARKTSVQLMGHKLDSLDRKVDSFVDGFAKIDRLVDSVGQLTMQIARKEEADKYLQKDVDRIMGNVRIIELDIQELKEDKASSTPMRNIGGNILNVVIASIVMAILGLLFIKK